MRSPLRTPPDHRTGWTLALAFAAVVGSFVAATLAIRSATESIDGLAAQVVSNATPSIEHLAGVRGSSRALRLALSQYVDPRARTEQMPAQLDAELSALGDEVRAYLKLPPFPGEDARWLAVQQHWARFDELVQRTRRLIETGEDDRARALLVDGVAAAGERLEAAALEAIAFNGESGRQLALKIQETRRRAAVLEDFLTGFCVLLGVGAALVLDRQVRARRALAESHASALEARADELEQFAGRVAHDLRNPLATAKLAASALQRGSGREPVADTAARILRALNRAESLTSGLLEFARAGARPDPGARTSPAPILEDVVAGLAPSAEGADIEIRVEHVPPVLVACHGGVYLSLVSNLIRNAIKYMGSASERRIVVRVVDGAAVRTEVIDSGPGIEPSIQRSLFDPYVRAPGSGRDGLGLGLATVKKLVESHGGRVGLVSAPGAGSTFWFELPRAGAIDAVAVPPATADGPAASLPH